MRNLFFIALCLLLSCHSSNKEQENSKNETNSKEEEFKLFLKKFKTLPLPLQLRVHNGITLEGLRKVNEKEAKAFLNSDDNYYCYGMLDDTLHYYSLILLYPADRVVPRIFTFEKNGNFIRSEDLIIKGCSGDCGLRKCTSDCIIDERKNISLIDTTDIYECDENGEEILSSRKHTVEIKKFYLGRLGRFISSQPERIDLLAK